MSQPDWQGTARREKAGSADWGCGPVGRAPTRHAKKPGLHPPPSFRKPGTGTVGRRRQGDQGIRVILSYIMGSRPAWATRDNVSKNRIQCTLPQPPPRCSPRRGGQPGQSCLLSAFPSPTPGTNLKSAPVPRPLVPSPQVTPTKDRAASCSQERWDIRGPCIEPPWSL